MLTLSANVLQQITRPIQRGPLQSSDLEFLQVISSDTLADNIPKNSSLVDIDILVGLDYFWDIIGRERVALPSSLLLLSSSSKLGYILTGKYCDPIDIKDCEGQITACVVTSHASDPCSDLWSLEKIGITGSPYVKEDDEALEHCNNTVSYQDGRYFASWPWRSSAIANMIHDNIYIDNLCVGANSVDEACSIYKEAKEIFKRASMNLREWSSNSTEFLNCLSVEERSIGKVFRVFGLLWNHVEDYLQMPKFKFVGSTVTKREVLSYISQIYDPLVMVAPAVLFGKLFLQKLWSYKLDWDDSFLPPLFQERENIAKILQ